MNNLEIALLVWLTYPVLASVSKGFTYATLSFARGEINDGLLILSRVPAAVLLMASWPYTATVGAILKAIEFDAMLRKMEEEVSKHGKD